MIQEQQRYRERIVRDLINKYIRRQVKVEVVSAY